MSQKRWLLVLSFAAFLLLIVTYSNHFDNGFYFDDSHTITSNVNIRDIGNIPKFFTNPETASILPGNRSYRPLVVTMNAVDYWIAGKKYDQFYYHLDIFITYILQLVLLFFFFRNIFNISNPHRWNDYFAFAAACYYGFHTANAETVNYIICRSDSLSTFFVVAAFVAFQTPLLRRYHLYLVPLALGMFTKQPVAMFPLLLTLYILLFEEKANWKDVFGDNKWQKWRNTFKASAVTWIATIFLLWFNLRMTPMSPINRSVSKVDYLFSQFPIMVHYIGNFFFPFSLSADPDFKIIENNPTDPSLMSGLMVVLFTIAIALWVVRQLRYRPITFGILWFYIALAPTSTLAPRFQVANDHRTFFPYIGLVLAVVCLVSIWIINNEKRILRTPQLRTGIPLLAGLLISLYAFGTYQRNEVWGSSESLWKDVAEKSPENGRGLMNYGLTQMKKGKKNPAYYDTTFVYFNKALVYNPNYSQLFVNFAELKELKGGYSDEDIEKDFKKAMENARGMPGVHAAYGNWLYKKGRIDEAIEVLEKGHKISPDHPKINKLLAEAGKETESGRKEAIDDLQTAIKDDPTPEKYIKLATIYYKMKNYDESIKACNEAIALKPTAARAYAQLASAYIKKGDPDKGITNAQKALEIEPKFTRAKNILKWAVKEKAKATGQTPEAVAESLGLKLKFNNDKK